MITSLAERRLGQIPHHPRRRKLYYYLVLAACQHNDLGLASTIKPKLLRLSYDLFQDMLQQCRTLGVSL